MHQSRQPVQLRYRKPLLIECVGDELETNPIWLPIRKQRCSVGGSLSQRCSSRQTDNANRSVGLLCCLAVDRTIVEPKHEALNAERRQLARYPPAIISHAVETGFQTAAYEHQP